MNKGGSIYILTNKKRNTLYTGVTSNLPGRIWEHKEKIYPKTFTAKYNLSLLVYYESYFTIEEAIMREKQLKAGNRKNKIKLIDSLNPEWKDLYEEMILNW